MKIAVLGFGLNGLMCAIAFAHAGFEVEIYEEGDLESYRADLRTSVLTAQTLDFLKEFELLEGIKKHSAAINHIYTFEGSEDPVLAFDSYEKEFGVVIANFELKRILIEKVHSLKIRINQSKVENIVQTESFAFINEEQYKLIFDCTGKKKNSDVMLDYKQIAFIFNISHTIPHKNIAVESFNPQGPLAILPMQNPLTSGVIWSVKTSSSQYLQNLPRGEFLNLFKHYAKRMEHIGEVQEITSQIKSYPLALTFQKSWYEGRIVKIGDALNSIHPVAGQAFNMSVQDIKNFYFALQEATTLGLDVGGESFVKSVLKRNLPHHLEMNIFTHLLVRTFSNDNNFLKFARNTVIEGLENFKPAKQFLIKKASGV